MKTCKDCKKDKPLSEFGTRKNYNNNDNGDYIKSFCKGCMIKRTYKWREKNPKKYKDYQTDYQTKYAKIVHKKVRKNSTS